ncbi:MAG TPA: nucleotidyltransferase family protein [Baekduia sp.]|uniref:nucleotidyltransferase family protein n=1 Tax=Baekduia sp. TaxID=2600305 RepID=UPI002BE772DA|nr:nucleotidyltransferase family protein [Baekduia sp.]HMJ32967.1 nucleotidyltransferase family protein [Baekduia sp.]
MSGGVAGLVLAAGAGSRFTGGVKQLAAFRGRPLVEHAVSVLATPALAARFVVLGAEADAIVAGADLGDARVVRCAGWEEGLSASLRAGVAAASAAGLHAVVIVLGDQPLLATAAVDRVVAARAPERFDAVRATYAGVPGHPTLLESSTFAAVSALRGDAGARELLPSIRVQQVACDGLGRPDDADTPADLARLAAG